MDLQELKVAAQEKQQAPAIDYTLLVRQYVDGVEVEPLDVIGRLAAAGKTVDDLEADAQKLIERRNKAEIAATMPSARTEQIEAEAEAERLKTEWANLVVEYRGKIAACELRVANSVTKWSQAHEAATWLRNNCTDIVLLERESELLKLQAGLHKQIVELDGTLDHPGNPLTFASKLASAKLGVKETIGNSNLSGGEIAKRHHRLAMVQSWFDNMANHRADLRKQKAVIDAELSTIAQQKLNA